MDQWKGSGKARRNAKSTNRKDARMKTLEQFGRQASESAVGWLLRPRNHGRFCLLHEPEKGVFERQMFVQMKRPRSGR